MPVFTRKFNPEQDSDLFDPKTGNCSIEYYNACKDPYRVSGDELPVPWPWICGRVSCSADDLFDQLEERIRKVLSDYNITPWIMGAYNKAARVTPEDARDVILIRTRDKCNISWKKAVSEIYYRIVEPAAAAAGIKTGVEICNEDKMYMDASSFIKDDAVINAIAKTQPFVLDAVMGHCPGKWTSITYHNRGALHYDSEKKPTVIIFIRPGAIHAWGELEEKIISAIQSAPFAGEIEIGVEILPGRLSLTRPVVGRSLGNSYLGCPPMVPSNGSSIAPSNCTDAAGSLGPVVNYRAAGEEEDKTCFLTCYNVIASGDPVGKATNDSRGIGLNGGEVGCKIDIEYPSKYDARKTRTIELAYLEKKGEAKRDDEVLQRLDEIAARGPIGRVKFASGYQLSDNHHRMDWALVELNPTLPLQNLLPMVTQFRMQSVYGVPAYRAQEGDTVSGTNSIFGSRWYGKVGRTSDCTSAKHGLIKRAIAWDDGMVSHEYEFKAKGLGNRFALEGDEGSLVFNLEKEWVGMLIAADRSTDIGFVTPVSELMRDIEETTGGTITLV